MAHWVRTHTDSNEVLLVPPNLKNPYFSFERPVVATFEHIPPSPTDVVEWYARMEALNGGSPIEGHGFDARGNLARRYRTLDSSQLATIGSQYGASLYLTDNRSRTDLVLVHRTHRLACTGFLAQNDPAQRGGTYPDLTISGVNSLDAADLCRCRLRRIHLATAALTHPYQ